MRRRRVGRTALEVSELGFGAAPIGNLYDKVDDEMATSTVDAAWDVGIRYFDTAPHYGLGLSEQRLGAALASRPRHEYVLSTKVGRLLVPNPAPTGLDLEGFAVADDLTRQLDYSADGVKRSIEASLKRLRLDRIDIVLVHDPDQYIDQAIAEAIPALVDLREQGVVGAVGVGMNQWQAPLRVVRESDVDAVMLAGRWTLLDRSGAELLDACAAAEVSVLAAAPFNSGLLAEAWPPDGARFDYEEASAQWLGKARSLATTCQKYGVALPQAALQFPLRHPAVATVVAGMDTIEHVIADAAWFDAAVPDDLWFELAQRT